jgi:hypothetical protein
MIAVANNFGELKAHPSVILKTLPYYLRIAYTTINKPLWQVIHEFS